MKIDQIFFALLSKIAMVDCERLCVGSNANGWQSSRISDSGKLSRRRRNNGESDAWVDTPLRSQGNPENQRIREMKKLVLFGALAVVGLTAVFGTAGLSYIRTGYQAASDSVRQNVPVEWEIKRARQMIDDLKPEITRNMQLVAREEVGVERLAADVTNKNQQIAKAKQDIMRLKGDLESGSVRFVYAGRDYSCNQVKDDLAARFKQFQVHEKTATKLTQILSAREKNLAAARRKLDEMLSAKRQLEVEVENLQARLTMVQVAQTVSPVALDDSHLSGTRQLLDDIRTRIDVAEKLAASEGPLEGSIPLDETASEDLLSEIADYFGAGRAEVESLVSKIEVE